ncbi:MAG: TRAM domain-containing protein, partial [Pseudomonadota bacterium]
MAEVTIDYLGRQGDGIAREADSQIYVPFTLPGERVSVSGKGQRRGLVELHKKSPERIEPVCSHFGTCGGCQLQHVSDDTYKTWKRSLVTGL